MGIDIPTVCDTINRIDSDFLAPYAEDCEEMHEALKSAVFLLQRVDRLKDRMKEKRLVYRNFTTGKYSHGFCACIAFVERFLNGEEN